MATADAPLLAQLPRDEEGEEQLLDHALRKIDHDFDFLMECFEEVLREQGEDALADALPRSARAVADAPPSADRHRQVQVLSIAFQLLNLVEENTAAQARRAREAAGRFTREPGLWGQNLRQLLRDGFTPEQIAGVLPRVRVEPVLTAHPTEAKRPIVLRQHRAVYLLLVRMENRIWTPVERAQLRDEMKAALELLWRTGEIFLVKPEVGLELETVLHYLRSVFPPMVERVDDRLRQSWGEAGLDPALLPGPSGMPRVSFGTWVGGDRDGHPFVTGEVTRRTFATLRRHALDLVDHALHELSDSLSLSSMLQPPPRELAEWLEDARGRWPAASDAASAHFPLEPFRQCALLLRWRLPESPEAPEGIEPFAEAAELAAELERLRGWLASIGASRLADFGVARVERLVRVFGFHLACLDIRQNSGFHDKAVGQMIAASGAEDAAFADWTEERRLAFLERELASPRPFLGPRAKVGPEAAAVLECYRVLADEYWTRGRAGIGSLVVSMTRQLSDLLVVYLFCREAGLLVDAGGGPACPVPVVPLFERVEDLRASGGVLAAFLDHPVSARSRALEATAQPVQEVMVGYSDSNKDGGILASQWQVHCAQARLADLCEERGVVLRVFHGRGGTISRGAGPTHRFLEALPHGALHGDLRLTEQGETIAQKYANLITATHNMELLLAGTAAQTLRHGQDELDDQGLAEALDALADASRRAYQRLIARDGFLRFWSRATPIDALEESSIGSRPSRRTGRRTLDDLRAIPWVFSWNQSRFYLPGWYGVGSALEEVRAQSPDRYAVLRERGARMPFLRYVLTNCETSLASASEPLMREYAALVEEEDLRAEFLDDILGEWRRSQRLIDELFDAPRERRRPRMVRTIALRESGLRQLHLHQLAVLREWRHAKEHGHDARAAALLPTLLLTVNAIASGQRTTG